MYFKLSVLPKHFLPPLAINAMLGTVLWSTYSASSSSLEGHVSHPLVQSAISGAVAGGAQAIVAAPAENVRLVLEGGSAHSNWSSAWKDVFLGTRNKSASRHELMDEARQLRRWMSEVSDMAGRGWRGWGWGFAKDICGM